jgi:hypothetical protein
MESSGRLTGVETARDLTEACLAIDTCRAGRRGEAFEAEYLVTIEGCCAACSAS